MGQVATMIPGMDAWSRLPEVNRAFGDGSGRPEIREIGMACVCLDVSLTLRCRFIDAK
jgi:hypothetical protein